MKFMKLGTRPDTFFSTETERSISSDVTTDLKIKVDDCLYHLHKFPLFSKCLRLQTLRAESRSDDAIIRLPDFPGGAESFETCAKFCYGITITISALNIVPVRCAAGFLGMTDDVDRGNLTGKLDSFLNSCILHRWKDTLVTLNQTRQYASFCEELGITGRCIDGLASMIITHCCKTDTRSARSKLSWAEDISELEIDLYWRIMVGVKSAGAVPARTIGKALYVYACRWVPAQRESHTEEEDSSLTDSIKEITMKNRLLLEKLVTLLPTEKGSVSCSFLLSLLKAANSLNASDSCKTELARRIGVQLEEATIKDLLIPSDSYLCETLYDVDLVMSMLDEFMLQGPSPPTSPPRDKLTCERRRSRSAENVEFELQEYSRRSSSAQHSSKLRVAKLVDGYLIEIARDPNLPVEKLVAIAKAVPDFARMDHDDLYRAVDIYLRAHPLLDKSSKKQLCRILDCKKLSMEACMHAAQNEMLPSRMVVQVLFFEQARTATSASRVIGDLPTGIRALLAKSVSAGGGGEEEDNEISCAKSVDSKAETLKMKLEEDEDDMSDVFMGRESLMRSNSLRFKAAFCAIPAKPKRMLGKLWPMNRSISERH